MTTVLVVDDVAPLAEQYAYDLKRVGGYATLVAAGGREALELLRREAVDCIVLDLEMPGMDGFDVLRAIGEQGIRTSGPIAVSRFPHARSAWRCVRRGSSRATSRHTPGAGCGWSAAVGLCARWARF